MVEENGTLPVMGMDTIIIKKTKKGEFQIGGPDGFNDIIYEQAAKALHEVHHRMNYLRLAGQTVPSPEEDEEDRKIIPFVFARPR